MIFLYIAVLLLVLCGSRLSPRGVLNDCLEKTQCNSIKGICISCVFISHVSGYLLNAGYEYNAFGDRLFQSIGSHLGQLIVVMFLFYSGYGVMEAVKTKGADYVRVMPRRRLLSTLLNYNVAILVFVAIDLLLGVNISASQVVASLIAWDSVGNSNWYVFVILLCYSATYVVSLLVASDKAKAWVLFISLLIISFALSFLKQPWWYNTMIAYSAGATWSVYKVELSACLRTRYAAVALIIGLTFMLIYAFPYEFHGLRHNCASVAFALVVVLVTMKISIRNPVLQWLGAHLFPIYIYQRLPMMCAKEMFGASFLRQHHIVFVLTSLAVTLALAHLYRHWKIDIGK